MQLLVFLHTEWHEFTVQERTHHGGRNWWLERIAAPFDTSNYRSRGKTWVAIDLWVGMVEAVRTVEHEMYDAHSSDWRCFFLLETH